MTFKSVCTIRLITVCEFARFRCDIVKKEWSPILNQSVIKVLNCESSDCPGEELIHQKKIRVNIKSPKIKMVFFFSLKTNSFSTHASKRKMNFLMVFVIISSNGAVIHEVFRILACSIKVLLPIMSVRNFSGFCSEASSSSPEIPLEFKKKIYIETTCMFYLKIFRQT